MIDMSADEGWLATCLRIMHIVQMVIQGRWLQDSTLMTLPSISAQNLHLFVGPHREPIESLPELLDLVESDHEALAKMLRGSFSANHIEHVSGSPFLPYPNPYPYHILIPTYTILPLPTLPPPLLLPLP